MKIVINKCYGGFGLSPAALLALFEEGWTELGTPVAEYWKDDTRDPDGPLGKNRALKDWREFQGAPECERVPIFLTVFSKGETHVVYFDRHQNARTDPRLVEIVERMGDAASGPMAKLRVVEIPDGVDWELDEYDGIETVREKHRSWS